MTSPQPRPALDSSGYSGEHGIDHMNAPLSPSEAEREKSREDYLHPLPRTPSKCGQAPVRSYFEMGNCEIAFMY